MFPPGALYHHTLGAYRISVWISPRHPAADNICYSDTQLLRVINYSMGTVTYLHSLLSPAHRLQVARHCRRVDKVICQKFEPITTSCCSLRHRCRTNWPASWISGERTTTSMLVSGSASSRTSSVTPGAAVTTGSDAAPAVISASGATPSTGTASGIAAPSTCAPVKHKPHDISILGL
jgi:hypothetical protein